MTREQAKEVLAGCADRDLRHLQIQLKYPTMFHADRTQDRIRAIKHAVKILLGDDHTEWHQMTREKIAKAVVERG